jgi:hypothetical protein
VRPIVSHLIGVFHPPTSPTKYDRKDPSGTPAINASARAPATAENDDEYVIVHTIDLAGTVLGTSCEHNAPYANDSDVGELTLGGRRTHPAMTRARSSRGVR